MTTGIERYHILLSLVLMFISSAVINSRYAVRRTTRVDVSKKQTNLLFGLAPLMKVRRTLCVTSVMKKSREKPKKEVAHD